MAVWGKDSSTFLCDRGQSRRSRAPGRPARIEEISTIFCGRIRADPGIVKDNIVEGTGASTEEVAR